LSEFNVIKVGLNVLFVPIVKLIGIIFVSSSCNPVPENVRDKFERLYTSIYPPTPSTEKLVP
jgi:hypothetical protein